MGEIHLLDQGTINKIAAGEVVERPSAVVKELVENAIDAGANAVTVEIKGGGVELIRITDNGSGIEKEQVQIAFERHATSKIRTAEDLLSVDSLGFRGEALASISAVAQVELVTKTRGALMGVRYVIEGGTEKTIEDIGSPEGTTFVVRNLFYNVPARRKFLKSAQTETSYINDLVERLAISHPDISFKFMSNNQLKLQTSGNGNPKDIIYHVFGRDITSHLLPVEENFPAAKISGFVAKPVVNRGNRNYMNYFINGRYIKSKVINKAIEDAYKPYMMQHRYPMTALHFQVDSQYIDVNVHPTKMEIRFTNGQAVYQAVFDAVSDALSGKNMIPAVSIGKEKKTEKAPVAKSAPEPFEKRRGIQENNSLGKQKVEAAKLLSQFEEIKKKQSKLNEETNYKTKVSVNPISAKPVGGGAIVSTYDRPSVKEESKPNISVSNGIEKENTEKVSESTKIAEEKVEEKKETLAKESVSEKKEEIQSQQDKSIATKINEREENQEVCLNQTETQEKNKAEELPEETIWDKTNSKQERLFGDDDVSAKVPEVKKQYKIVGQVFDTYWIIQYEDKMFIVDQHAAHEKVLFERTMRTIENKEITSQLVQPPIILSLSMREQQALLKHKEELEKIGFEIEAFGGREFSVRAVPANLFGVAQVELLTELLDSLTEDVSLKNSDVILEKVASMSCKAAVKGNMKLSILEAEALIEELMDLENPYHCPHGRPVIVSMSKYEIEKKFKRVL